MFKPRNWRRWLGNALRWVRRSQRGPAVSRKVQTGRPAIDDSDPTALVEQMLTQGRYALLLREQLLDNLTATQRATAGELLMEQMALVPVGDVVLGEIDELLDDGQFDSADLDRFSACIVPVDPFFVDRTSVTNRQFAEFVASGGYSELAIWDREVWPAMIDFVDQTGQPGPRLWRDGTFLDGQENYPVVGVSWFEAAAYARWVGKRLPTDAEWVKAGAWPVQLSPTARVQRKFPWGNAMQVQRANLWGSGPGQPVDADRYPEGDSVGGVRQLIGNTWEWTSGWFGEDDLGQRPLVLSSPMRSIRGGAFDTYFETQATCQFQSGENPIQRKHNIGFRCAISACDVAGVGNWDGSSRKVASRDVADNDEPALVVEDDTLAEVS